MSTARKPRVHPGGRRPQRPPATEFGRMLNAARIAAGLPTAAAAAARLGMTQPNYYRLEHWVHNPPWTTITRLINGLHLPLEYFFGEDQILAAAARIKRRRRAATAPAPEPDPEKI